MTQNQTVRLSSQLLLGLVVATLGVLFTLDNLDVLEARDYLRYWPAALIALGVVQIVQAQAAARMFGGAIWILVGGTMLGNRLGFFRVEIWNYWPMFLVLAGAYIIWQAFNKGPSKGDQLDSSSTVSAIAVMSGFARKINSQEFRGGELTAFMGGCELDLRKATPANGEAIIDIFVMMGGIEIKVPESWTVEIKVMPFMGGFEDATKPPAGGSGPRLVVRGFAVMGGLGVKN